MSSFDSVGTGDLDATLASEQGLVVLDFWASWCGRCAALDVTMESVMPGTGVRVLKVNIEEEPDLAAAHRVMSVPALAFYKDGKKLKTVFGEQTESDLLGLVGELS